MNSFNGIGNLTKDPEMLYTDNGNTRVKTAMAISRGRKDQHGKELVDFFNIEAWGKTAELIGEYFRKGSKIGVTGSVHFDTYDKADGSGKGYKLFVVVDRVTFCDKKAAEGG